jgi:hypothetical protein
MAMQRSNVTLTRTRRGNTLILVTAILVLLVIIATAFISRAQGGRAIASAQRKALDRVDRSELAIGVVIREISSDLFPKLVNSNDPGLNVGTGVATTATPRLSIDQWSDGYGVQHDVERYGVDPQWVGDENGTVITAPRFPYNVASFETKAWTNWPDSSGGVPSAVPLGKGNPNGLMVDAFGLVIGDSDPIGNPGFGDSRWLRSSEPVRSRDNLGIVTGYSHWQHLSFPATGENGWRVCFDIQNIAPFTGDPVDGATLTYTAAEDYFVNGDLGGGYFGIQSPVALQSPYEQWLPNVVPAGINNNNFGEFIGRRDQWFSAPNLHFQAVAGYAPTLPNLFRLNDLGPKRDEFKVNSKRNIISRTFADSDGDGLTDAFWFLLPGTSEDGVRQVAAVSVIDNAAMVDVEVATRFDRWSTRGQTPADLALTSRLFTTQGEDAREFDQLDTWTGLFSDPQNTWPANTWGFSFVQQSNPSYWGDGGSTFSPEGVLVTTQYNPLLFGDNYGESVNWLRRMGVVLSSANDSTPVLEGLEGPFKTLLAASPSGWDLDSARFDRRRYFHMRSDNEKFYAVRRNADGSWISGQELTTSTYLPRSFGASDELELRLFNGANFGPIITDLERTINAPWDYNYNLFRSTLTRSESVENWLEYANPDTEAVWPPSPHDLDGPEYDDNGPFPPGNQLTPLQLLRDTRHRTTTYSATRNDLRPLYLRSSPIFLSQNDYLFGRATTSRLLAQGDPFPTTPGHPHFEANRAGYEYNAQKLDLRSSLDRPLDAFEARLYSGFGGEAYFSNPFGFWQELTSPTSYDELIGRFFDPSTPQGFSLRLDRAYRSRLEMQATLDRVMGGVVRDNNDTMFAQSYLGDSFRSLQENQMAYLKTLLLNASWTANVDAVRNSKPAGVLTYNLADSAGIPAAAPVWIDQPIYPDWAPRVSLQTESFLPQDLQNLTFVGTEKQPFIMETFFALAYPKSKMETEGPIEVQLEGNELYTNQFGDDPIQTDEDRSTIPEGFPDAGENWVDSSSKPALIFAIQIANPYDAPVSLADIRLRIAGNPRMLNFARIPCPHPSATAGRVSPYFYPNELMLGPTTPDAPRTAIVYGIIPPDNQTGQVFEDNFGIPFGEFHAKMVDFLDLEPGNLFGYDAALGMPALQTLVFDASPKTFHRGSPDVVGTEYTPLQPSGLSTDLETWFEEPEVSVELMRFAQNPVSFDPASTVPGAGYLYTIDRLDNELTGERIMFKEHMAKLLDQQFKPYMPQAFKYDNFRKVWNGIRLKTHDMFVTWVRAGRPWGWDRNRNGFYDMSEVSPRYVYSEIPEGDWISQFRFRSEDSAEPVAIGQNPGPPGGGGGGGGGGAGSIDLNAYYFTLDSDPDGDPSAVDEDEKWPWMWRSYILPLATKFTSTGGTGFDYEFETARTKPVHFTTTSALLPMTDSGTRIVDYDAGFPVYASGRVRTGVDPIGWPGRHAGDYQWVMMDKGQAPREVLPGNRSGVPIGQDSNANGVDDGLEQYGRLWLEKDQWAYPLQMLQKNADFDSIGELANTFLWGHALRHRPGFTSPESIGGIPRLPTVATFGEIMNGTKADDLFPVVRADLGSLGVPNPGRIHTNRWLADQGNLTAQPGAAVEPFRPFTQVLEVNGVYQPWTPMLPAGTGIFDAVVCDGPGVNHTYVPASGVADPLALPLRYKDDSFRNAAGFSGEPTRGLLNLNTASPEVLRTLPHMSRLVYNDSRAWANTQSGMYFGYTPADPFAGDVDDEGVPKGFGTRNNQWVRVPEMIDRYRRGGGLYERVVQEGTLYNFGGQAALPAYLDRGTIDTNLLPQMAPLAQWLTDNLTYPSLNDEIGLFPGMRRDAGIASIGELLLLDRGGVATGDMLPWVSSSTSMRGAAADPYAYQKQFGHQGLVGANTSPAVLGDYEWGKLLGLGWRAPFDNGGLPSNYPAQIDSRLSTDVNHHRFRQWAGTADDPAEVWVEVPDNVAMDAEESNLLFAGISNLVSTRSDTFTVYMQIRSFKQNPVTGVWNAMDPEYIVDNSRYVFVVDRSACNRPSDEPEIRLMSKVPN